MKARCPKRRNDQKKSSGSKSVGLVHSACGVLKSGQLQGHESKNAAPVLLDKFKLKMKSVPKLEIICLHL